MSKKILSYVAVIVLFIIIAYAYNPLLLRGRVVNQSDISSWVGMSHEIVSYNETHPDDPTLWTNSMFSGMPASAISVIHKGNWTEPIYNFLLTGARPASYMIISLIGGFLLFLAFGTNIWIAALGAVAISFCSYNMQIIQVGHNTKMLAIAYMPWVLASLVYAYRKNALWGALFFAFTLSFQIKAGHPQISYYLAIIVLGFAVCELCGAVKQKIFPKFIKTSVLVLAAGLLGIATNATSLLPTYEYAKYTMRGGSELSKDKDVQTGSGLKIDYATAWSYGIGETPNLMIPDFNGGSSSGELSKKSETYKVLRSKYQGADSIIKNMPLYWGPQPFTAGPMYIGAICAFLFVLGLCIIKGRYKWWIAGVSLLALFLAWGSHMMWFSELFFKYVPLYNKFRTVSMALVVFQITIPLLGVLTVNELVFGNRYAAEPKKVKRGFYFALAATAGVALIFAIFPSLAGNFSSPADASYPQDIASALVKDRKDLLQDDALRSVTYIAIAAALLWLGYMKKLKPVVCITILSALILTDMWTVGKRYLNDSHYVRKQEFSAQFKPREVDNMILKDKDPYYRVLDLSVNTFNDSYISYFHKTIGGYSPAKLQRYQDLIEYYIAPEIGALTGELNKAISSATTVGDVEKAVGYHKVLSMLNTKYIVIGDNTPPLTYHQRLGNCWLVENVLWASTPDQEIESIAQIDPAASVILPQGTASKEEFSSEGSIKLTSYAPNRLKYSYSSATPSLAVFSEIYYPAGWKATVDGEEIGILRANYALRALELPEGEHEIEFVFSPESYRTGANISRASSALLFLLLILMALYSFALPAIRKHRTAQLENKA